MELTMKMKTETEDGNYPQKTTAAFVSAYYA
jgi:hypothetical protein